LSGLLHAAVLVTAQAPVSRKFLLLSMAVAIGGIALFVLLAVLIRKTLRSGASEELAAIERTTPREENSLAFEAMAYSSVIARFKEQEKELERLRASERERAAATENISQAVLSNLASGVLVLGLSGTVRQANAAAKEILGYQSPFNLHARDIFRGVLTVREEGGAQPSEPSLLLNAINQTLREGLTFRRMEAEYQTPQGHQRILGITLSPVRSAAGEPLGAACLISDLTEITRLSRQIALQQNLAALGEMSAGIAHEFKNSLATIAGYAQMLRSEQDLKTAHEFAARIGEETSSLTRIVTHFLNFARPREIVMQELDAAAILEDCAREAGVALQLRGVEGLRLLGDSTAIRQVFANLLRNSAEAARPGAPATVIATAIQEGDRIRLELSDNGAGISPQTLGRVFLPFFTTKNHGTGLGLALVHRIVTEHGGTITAASDGSGATFTLSLPAKKPAQAASESH